MTGDGTANRSRLAAQALAWTFPALVALLILLQSITASATIEPRRIASHGRWAVFVAIALFALPALRSIVRTRGRSVVPLHAGITAIAVLAALSIFWSVDRHESLKQAGGVLLLLTSAGLAAWHEARTAGGATRLVTGIVAGVAAVLVASVVTFLVDHHAAVAAADRINPARFRGIGENPNTVPILLVLVFPLLPWVYTAARGRAARGAVVLVGAGMLAMIFAAAARGAIVAAVAGTAVTILLLRARPRRRLGLLVALAAVAVIGIGVSTLPKPNPHAPVRPGQDPNIQPVTTTHSWLGKLVPRPGTLLTGSGRTEAWSLGIRIADTRPVAGHGVGTEPLLIAPYNSAGYFKLFSGDYVENSYLGTYLELGALGLAALALVGAALLRSGVAAVRSAARDSASRLQAACACGLVAGGVVQAVSQSYLLRVGNLGAFVFWTGAFVLAATARRHQTASNSRTSDR